jgi:hypothetical protein
VAQHPRHESPVSCCCCILLFLFQKTYPFVRSMDRSSERRAISSLI